MYVRICVLLEMHGSVPRSFETMADRHSLPVCLSVRLLVCQVWLLNRPDCQSAGELICLFLHETIFFHICTHCRHHFGFLVTFFFFSGPEAMYYRGFFAGNSE